MAEIKVTSNQLKEKSQRLKSASANIQTLQNEIDSEVNRIKPAWTGEASEAFSKKYLTISSDLKGIYETINKYSAFLDEAAASFAEAELKSAGAAESVK